MADQQDAKWRTIADTLERNHLLTAAVQSSQETGADFTLSVRLEGTDRYLTISTGSSESQPEP